MLEAPASCDVTLNWMEINEPYIYWGSSVFQWCNICEFSLLSRHMPSSSWCV